MISREHHALTLTEIISDAKDNDEPLIITLMDTSKAFDIVSHTSMLNSLYSQGVHGVLWRSYESMYTNIRSQVKWQGELSSAFKEGQGIRQGGNSSTDQYKAGKNDLLRRLDFQPGHKIGSINAGAIMVADDLALTSNCPYSMQTSLSIAQHDAAREQYKFNTEKTKFITINTPADDVKLVLNGTPLGHSTSEPHLGIIRNSEGNNQDTVEKRLKDARSQVFSLLGTGFRGFNGAGPEVARLEYNTYILPTYLYGLEALVLERKELQQLSDYHKHVLRCIQHFPKCTALPAIYLLMGVAPMEALLDIRILCLFHSIVSGNKSCPPGAYMQELVSHQLAMKDLESSSWTTQVRKLLTKYGLPPASELLEYPPTKATWKTTVKAAVHDWWTKSLCAEAQQKSTLKYLLLSECRTDKIHSVWKDLHSPLSIQQATVHALLLIQRYPLTTSPVSGVKQSDKCPLCKGEPETVEHFLLQCPALQQPRMKYLPQILHACRKDRVSIHPESLVSVILDTTRMPSADMNYVDTCRKFTYKLHSVRSVLLGGEPGYRRAFV